MHPHIRKLFDIAAKPERMIIGLMSGTSVDGLDIALCRIRGSGYGTRADVLKFETVPYLQDFRDEIRSVFARKTASLEKLCLLNPWIARVHSEMILACLKKWNEEPEQIDLIASHGQTIYHAPRKQHGLEKFPDATLQIGDGDHLAYLTGIITVSDFRQKHVAAGGEGAPLAVYGDYWIFGDRVENRIMLNMGGIANFTLLPASGSFSQVFSTDTGPGNTMMDAYMQVYFPGNNFDENARVASSGKVNQQLLNLLKHHEFFDLPFPKTTGPEVFNLAYLRQAADRAGVPDLPQEDVMATLNRFSAETITDAIRQCMEPGKTYILYASGGGIHNPLLMQHIGNLLSGMPVRYTHELDVHPDAKEAVLFAILANETVAGSKLSPESGRPGMPAISMGKISFPD
jgi:anhydro-N-acetylmuramic acid kinase